MSKLSEQLIELMNEDGYTQTSLAKAMNTPRAKISLYKSGKSVPDFKYLIAIVEFFNCSADFLIGLKEEPKRENIYNPVPPFKLHLRKLFEQKGKSQYSFIKEKEVSWNTLHGWLTGKSLPSIENLKKLANFFGCSVDYILGRES